MANFNLGNLVWKITADSATFVSGLKGADQRLSAFEQRAKAVGTSLTKFVTLPIAAAAGASVKFASDLQESTNAVNVVFGDSARIITAWGENAAEQAGLSQAAFNETATQIGVLLQQTGKDFDAVAEDTITLTQRAADLASIYNTDVKDATIALGAALRGESEPARRFGVLLSEAEVQAKALALGLGGVGRELTEAEKVQARYQIILDSTNAVAGDFARTNDDTANSLRVLRAQAENLAADLGQELLPIFADLLKGARDLVSGFSDLTDEQKSTVIAVAAVVAGIGPLVSLVGSTITAFTALKTAIIALNTSALFGPLGLIAGVAAATIALRAFADARFDKVVDEFGDSLVVAGAEIGVTVEKSRELADAIKFVSNAFSDANNFGGVFDLRSEIEKVAESSGLTAIEFARILTVAPSISDSLRQAALAMVQQADLGPVIEESTRGAARAVREQVQATEELVNLQARANDAVIARRIQLEQETRAEIALTNKLAEVGLINQEDATRRLANAYQREAGQLVELGYTLETGGQIGQQRLSTLLELIEGLKKGTIELGEASTTYLESDLALLDQYSAYLSTIGQNQVDNNDEEARSLQERTALWEKLVSAGLNPALQGFEQIGEAIYNGADAATVAGKVILQSLASVLRAIGAELAARAAVATVAALFGDFTKIPAIGVATAGAAAAYTAAGLISAAANNVGGGPTPRSTPQSTSIPSSSGRSASSATSAVGDSSSGGVGGGVINFTQNNIVNLDTDENIGKAARVLFPALKAEGIRRGETL